MGAVFPLASQSRSTMKVAIAICIVFVVVNLVYSEDSNNKDYSLSRDTREASPAKRKDGKVTSKGKKKQRKLKKKNEGKSKRNKNLRNANKEKKGKSKRNKNLRNANKEKKGKANKAQRNKSSNKKANNAKKKKKKTATRAQKRKKKMKTKKRKGKKRSRKGKRKSKRKNRKGKMKVSQKTKDLKTKDKVISHKMVNQIRQMKQDNSSSNGTTKLPNKLKCETPNKPAQNNYAQNMRFQAKYNLLENKLDKISVFQGYANLLGKITNDGTTCTEAAKAGYFLLNGCEKSAAAACNNTNFTATYLTAIGCVKTVNCSTTKKDIPEECDIKPILDILVDKTRECTNKTLVGTFSYCMNYIKEDVSADISGCLDEAPTTTQAPTTTPSPPVVETKTIFTEGDEVVEQNESYNPDTKELTLSVPAHGSNVALTAIIREDQMVTSYDNYCVLGDPPADHTTEVYENSDSVDEADEIDSASIVKVFSFNVVEGELTDAERAELPESFQTACKDKTIQKTRRIVVDEATFYNDSLVSIDDSRYMSRPRQGECSSEKVTNTLL